MSVYQLIASLVQSLAWPVAVVLVALLLRKQLRAFRVKHGDLDVSARLGDAESEAAKDPIPPTAATPLPTPEEKTKFDKMAELSPRAAILELRNELEDRVLKFAKTRGTKLSPLHTNVTFVARVLRQQGQLDGVTSALLDDLRVVGNASAHDASVEFTIDDARRFRALVEIVSARLGAIEAGQIKL